MAITTVEKVQKALNIDDKSEQIEVLIPLVENWIKGYTNQDMPDSEGNYPDGYEQIAIRMIAYDLNNIAKQGIQSEKLSRHSITYATSSSIRDYPSDVIKGLRRRLRW